jgi:ParB/RepB/Spo0J family partition protein
MNAMTPSAAILPAFAVGQLAVLRAVQALEQPTAQELAEKLGKTRNNVVRDLNKLQQHRLVETQVVDVQDKAPDIVARITPAGTAEIDAHDAANPVREAEPAAVGLPGAPPPAGFTTLPHHLIVIGDLNPRKAFDAEALEELAADILARGLKQNLHVRPTQPLADGSPCALHELIAGERRWRAIGLLISRGDLPAEWPIPVLVEDLDEAGHALAALLENLQRVDLTPLEEAAAFHQLVKVNGWTTAEVAQRVSRSQRFVQLRLSLMDLTPAQREALDSGQITVKDAFRALANRPEPIEIAPDHLLALAEILCAANADDADQRFVWREAPCAPPTDPLDPVLAALIDQNLTYRPTLRSDGHYELAMRSSVHTVFSQHAPGLLKGNLAEALRQVRLAVTDMATVQAAEDAGTWITPWLNGPWPLTDAGHAKIEEVAQERAATEERRKRWAEEQRQHQEALSRAAERARALSDAQASTVTATHPGLWDTGEVAGIAAGCDHPLPWIWVESQGSHSADVLDAEGDRVYLGQVVEPLRLLLVTAANSAAGFPTRRVTEGALKAEAEDWAAAQAPAADQAEDGAE